MNKPTCATVPRPAADVPVIADVDVAVYGGSTTGVAAAVAAARAGCRVLLVEKYGFLGGTATAALVNIFHSRYSMDKSTEIVAGFGKEFLHRLLDMDAGVNRGPEDRGHYVVETEYAKLVLDRMMAEAEVPMLLHSIAVGAAGTPEHIAAVFVESKGGTGAVKARVHIDCTGDADIVARAGLPFKLTRGALQSPTLCFRLGGVDRAALDKWPSWRRDISDLLDKKARETGGSYSTYLWGNFNHRRSDELMLAAVRILNVDATDPWERSAAEVEARRQALWMLDALRAERRGFENATFVDLGAEMGIRETRRIRGAYVLTGDELLAGKRFDDAIAQGTYPVDIHAANRRGITFFRLDGTTMDVDENGNPASGYWTDDGGKRDTQFWQVPYRSLHFHECANLLVAGRPISVDRKAHAATRVMINCIQFGQAAGAAAALAARSGDPDVRTVAPAALRALLAEQGAIVM